MKFFKRASERGASSNVEAPGQQPVQTPRSTPTAMFTRAEPGSTPTPPAAPASFPRPAGGNVPHVPVPPSKPATPPSVPAAFSRPAVGNAGSVLAPASMSVTHEELAPRSRFGAVLAVAVGALVLGVGGCVALTGTEGDDQAKPRTLVDPGTSTPTPEPPTAEETWLAAAEDNSAILLAVVGQDDASDASAVVAAATTACAALDGGDGLDDRLAVTTDLLPGEATPMARRAALTGLIAPVCPELMDAHANQVAPVEAAEAEAAAVEKAEKAAAKAERKAKKEARRKAAAERQAAAEQAEREAQEAEQQRIRGFTAPGGNGGTDPNMGTCGAANDAGMGDYVRGVDPEYDWYQDRDGDGVVCER